MYRLSYFWSILKYRSSGTDGLDIAVQKHRRDRGFTLPELLITVAVSAILLAVAVPNFQSFVKNSQVGSTADGFLAALQQARSEAIKRGNLVVLCRTADPSGNTCGDSGEKDWSPGWLMYATPTDNSEGPYNPGSDHVLIRRGSPAPDGVTITSDDDGNTWLAFGGDGNLGEPNTGPGDPVVYAICDDRGESEGKLIVIREIGRPYLTDDFTDAPGCAPTG